VIFVIVISFITESDSIASSMCEVPEHVPFSDTEFIFLVYTAKPALPVSILEL
jgi:hypothetical protein